MRSSNIGQRLLCTLLCMVLLIGFLSAAPAASAAEAAAETGCDHTSVTWTEVGANTALSAASFAAGGSFKLTGDVHLADQVTLTAGKKLHIDLNGHVLSADGILFELNGQEAAKAVTLTICDSSAEHSGKVTMKGQDASGIVMTSFGTFNLYGGTLTGSTADSGGAVKVTSGTFNMYDGKITDCYATSLGGAIMMQNGTLTITGGTISGNKTEMYHGAAAQEYFGYKTEDLANAGLTEEQQAMASEEVKCTDGRVTGENYMGSRLVLESRISLQLAFKNVDESCYAVYTYTDHYGEEKSVTVDGADFIGGYGVELGELVLADAKQLVTCTVYNESDEAVASVTDSVESHIARATEENILHGAIMKFAASAYAYFH